ncbi:hypothetical protein [Jeotgalibacillus proteolyticus]|uniref:Prenyltransferase n=1 Tax=Jeotgalibacillus proteolyticus TaxID=2082395 RepID=A0A2S5G9L1_9BACL|nr:hypothetical protein [Jeotgalibacillus proteolyticus]PPA69678.1 hypothetical protein C4B60_14135 [Jeotgalibacillus proteolyticus]
MNILSKHLSKNQIIAINLFIQREARPVDRAFHLFRQGEASYEEVVRCLELYQNQDGGFGHALEPDSRLIDSSVLNTTVALQYLTQLPIKEDHPMIQRALSYLIKHFDETHQRWPIVPVTINHVPRAPWWNVNEETGETGFEKTPGNPAAEILGYFQYYREAVPADLIEKTEALVMQRFDEIQDEWDMHEVQCYYRLAQLTDQEEIKTRILSKMEQSLHDIFALSKEEWSSYGLQPISLIQQTDSPFYPELEEVVEENAHYLAEQLTSDGCFEPSWEWGQYPIEWEQAKKEWCSFLTVMACHPPKVY